MKDEISSFLKAKALPEKIDNDFVQGVQTALSGLIAIPIRPVELLNALGDSGAASTVDQLQSRFEKFLQKVTQGKEQSKVPIAFSSRGYTITQNDPLEFRQLPSVREAIPTLFSVSFSISLATGGEFSQHLRG